MTRYYALVHREFSLDTHASAYQATCSNASHSIGPLLPSGSPRTVCVGWLVTLVPQDSTAKLWRQKHGTPCTRESNKQLCFWQQPANPKNAPPALHSCKTPHKHTSWHMQATAWCRCSRPRWATLQAPTATLTPGCSWLAMMGHTCTPHICLLGAAHSRVTPLAATPTRPAGGGRGAPCWAAQWLP
jgi:hypothetical protein